MKKEMNRVLAILPANSLRYSGNAIDLCTRDMTAQQIEQAVTMLRKVWGTCNQAIYKKKSPHIHI